MAEVRNRFGRRPRIHEVIGGGREFGVRILVWRLREGGVWQREGRGARWGEFPAISGPGQRGCAELPRMGARKGEGVAKDLVRALGCYKRCADQGNSGWMAKYGMSLAKGDEFRPDPVGPVRV
jgi:hypothetical protein